MTDILNVYDILVHRHLEPPINSKALDAAYILENFLSTITTCDDKIPVKCDHGNMGNLGYK
jgi:hypothetical protein